MWKRFDRSMCSWTRWQTIGAQTFGPPPWPPTLELALCLVSCPGRSRASPKLLPRRRRLPAAPAAVAEDPAAASDVEAAAADSVPAWVTRSGPPLATRIFSTTSAPSSLLSLRRTSAPVASWSTRTRTRRAGPAATASLTRLLSLSSPAKLSPMSPSRTCLQVCLRLLQTSSRMRTWRRSEGRSAQSSESERSDRLETFA
mmetsp:Transcript_4441/g.9643  ORF Transcript_4441/g.9643 Transcript_4441/m.9643 type:complete len:200 (-) Transcript_4441:123-722(-)